VKGLDKPRLPEDFDMQDAHVSEYHQNALKTIATQLNDPTTPDPEKAYLMLQRAGIIREVTQGQQEAPLEPLSPEQYEYLTNEVFELVNPQPDKGNALRSVVNDTLYKGAKDPSERNKNLTKRGYDFGELCQLGLETKKKVRLGESATLTQLTKSERDGNPLYYSDLTVGASVELSRQMRKILAASLEGSPEKRMEILDQLDTDVSEESVAEYIKNL